ncbi:N-6 DNA methylase [Nocardia salmonicida]|uniref:N-6 DNA methylase n=1 Tax=Nocardia salmonicida TaxID=53431 RepID=UPI0037A13043
MSKPPGALSPSELAERIGVTISAVSNWRTRHSNFPSPTVVGGQELFPIPELVQWLGRRTVPRNRLRPDEAVGTTYGDRLAVASGTSSVTPVPSSVVVRRPGAATPGLVTQLWAVADRLRGAYPIDIVQELIISLIFLRTQQTDAWNTIAQSENWADAGSLLAETEMDFDGRRAVIPVFLRLEPAADRGLSEAIRAIDRIPLGFDAEDDDSDVSSFLEATGRRMGHLGGRYTPTRIADCLIGLLDPSPGSSLYDPVCGAGELLVAAARHGSPTQARSYQLYGGVQNLWNFIAAQTNLSVHGAGAQLRTTVLHADGFAGVTFDGIVTNPPYGKAPLPTASAAWRFGDPGRSLELAWLQHAYGKLSPEGRAAVVLPVTVAFQGGAVGEIRKRMVEFGALECVISLPPALFADTAVQTMIWVICGEALSRKRSSTVMTIDASGLGGPDRRRPELSADRVRQIVATYQRWRRSEWRSDVDQPGFAGVVDSDRLRELQFDLSPRLHCRTTPVPDRIETVRTVEDIATRFRTDRGKVTAADERIDAVLTDVSELAKERGRLVELGSICEVLQGPAWARAASDKVERGVTLVQARNIRDGRVSDLDLGRLDLDKPRDLDRYVVHEGDIVTARVGTLGRFGLVEHGQAGRILGSGCLRLRPTDGVRPLYLLHYLQSAGAQTWIAANSTGATIPAISTQRLRSMPVLLPTESDQNAVAGVLDLIARTAVAHSQLGALLDGLRAELGTLLAFPSGDAPV